MIPIQFMLETHLVVTGLDEGPFVGQLLFPKECSVCGHNTDDETWETTGVFQTKQEAFDACMGELITRAHSQLQENN